MKDPSSRLAVRAATALAAVALVAWPAAARAWCTGTVGEVTGDGLTNVTDVQCVILDALAEAQSAPTPDCVAPGGHGPDLDCSASVDVSDIQLAIGAALEMPMALSIDQNHNACPDACEPDPTLPGADAPPWQLEDFQPKSDALGTTYGMEAFEGRVTAVGLLASW